MISAINIRTLERQVQELLLSNEEPHIEAIGNLYQLANRKRFYYEERNNWKGWSRAHLLKSVLAGFYAIHRECSRPEAQDILWMWCYQQVHPEL